MTLHEAGPPLGAASSYDDVADRLLGWALSRCDVRALWLEGGSLEEIRRPYGRLAVHLAADEPDFQAIVVALREGLPALLGARITSEGEARRFAREFRLEAGDLAWMLIAERTSMLAKRPRAHVVPLLDRTSHLTHVMDFSLRKRAAGESRR